MSEFERLLRVLFPRREPQPVPIPVRESDGRNDRERRAQPRRDSGGNR